MAFKPVHNNEKEFVLKQSRWSFLTPAALASAGSVFLAIAFPSILDDYQNRTAVLLAGLGLIAVSVGFMMVSVIRKQPDKLIFSKKRKVLEFHYKKKKTEEIHYNRILFAAPRPGVRGRNSVELYFAGNFRWILMNVKTAKAARKISAGINEALNLKDPYLTNSVSQTVTDLINKKKSGSFKSISLPENLKHDENSIRFRDKYSLVSAFWTFTALTGICLSTASGAEQYIAPAIVWTAAAILVLIVFILLLLFIVRNSTAKFIGVNQDEVQLATNTLFAKKSVLHRLKKGSFEMEGELLEQSVLPEIRFMDAAAKKQLSEIRNAPYSIKRGYRLTKFYNDLPKLTLTGMPVHEAVNLFHWLVQKLN